MTAASSATVDKVLKGQLCTGCGLCAAVAQGAIRMETAPPGYSRPRVVAQVSDAAEAAIAAACPGAVVAGWGGAPDVHPYWGPWRRVAVGWATDDTIRHQASSGGGITGLAVHALRTGVVDRVVHVAADPDHPTRNQVVVSTSAAEVIAGAGSRYAPSSPMAVIEQVLGDGGRFAFIGKPCDASALRRLGRVDPRVETHAALVFAFFCAGISSHRAADRVIEAMGLDPAEVESFRYRGNGWPGNAAAVTRDGRSAEMSYAKSWGGHLSHEVQFRCKICPDAVGGVADIACADAWYGDDQGYPSFDERDGRSLIVARTAAGEQLLADAVGSGAVAIEPLDIGEIDRMQPSQARRKRLIRSRLMALTATLQPRPDVRGALVGAAAGRAGAGEQLKSLLGTMRRIVAKRR